MARYNLNLADRKLVNEITDADVLRMRLPRMETFFEGVREMRDVMASGGSVIGRYGRSSGWTPDGSMKRCASVPMSVFAAMLEIDPEFGTDEKKFLAWLREHPEYATTERVP